MDRPPFTAWHRPVIRAGVAGPDAQPITDWETTWAAARNTLLGHGLAFYVHGILVIAPHVTIQMETRYGK